MNYSRKYKKRGWFGESYRHRLARLGIKTRTKTSKRRQDIITDSFRKGEEALKREIKLGVKGDIISGYEELLIPHGPGIGYSKKKPKHSIKVIKGPKLNGSIMIDLDVIKKRHPMEFKIISNESYHKLKRTGVILKPNEDTDGDGIINIKDARPLNKKDFRDNSTLQRIADWVNNN